MLILYPADFFKPKKVDEAFRPEALRLRDEGFEIHTVNLDDLPAARRRFPSAIDGPVLYRGWMLDAPAYGQLVELIASGNGQPFTSEAAYLATHHIPNWAPRLGNLTAETIVLPNGSDFESELRKLGWDAFFVKDYVKSLKVSMGSKISDPSMIGALVEEMRKYRGTIEGGLCIRRVESLRPDTEQRFFVLNGEAYGAEPGDVPEIVQTCAQTIDSPFFSVDIAENETGDLRVVELGDGQVSDLVGWSVERFASVLATLLT